MQKGDLIFELKEKNTTTTIREITPSGIKLEFNAEGEVKGRYNAAHMETVNVLAKMDGTNEWEAKALEMTKEGDMVVAMGKGTGRQESPTIGRFEGEVTFMTQSKKLAWLNTTKGWIEGTNDLSKGEAVAKVYAKK